MCTMAESTNARKNYSIPNDLLNDLSSRFVINIPEEERVDPIRLCFQIELAHWFYLDFYCDTNPKLPKTPLKDFIRIIFGHIPFLQSFSVIEVDNIIANWKEYKKAVPTYGAILLDEEMKNVLLVQGFVYKASWSFPKGKVNKDEQPQNCAIREVLEETGFDITNFINKEEYLEHYFNDQLIRLYIVTDIPANAKFVPKTRNEIKGCEWFPISQLPTGKKDLTVKTNTNGYFMVIPFVKQLRKWIDTKSQEKEDIEFLKQQQLLAQLTRNEFAKYTENPTPAESRPIRQNNKSTYSPPPRMIRQRNLKQAAENEKKKGSQVEEKNSAQNKYNRKFNTESPKNEKCISGSKKFSSWENDGTYYPISTTWQNFSLDREALVAIFNITLRKTSARM